MNKRRLILMIVFLLVIVVGVVLLKMEVCTVLWQKVIIGIVIGMSVSFFTGVAFPSSKDDYSEEE